MFINLRSKNAKTLTMIAAILVVVVAIYAAVIANKEKEGEKEQETTITSEIEQLYELDLKEQYPASVREVVKLYCRVIEQLYNNELANDDFIRLADMERALFDEELLKHNTYGEFIERLEDEIKEYQTKQRKISKWEVEKNESVKYWYNGDDEYASINIAIHLSGKKPTIVRERFILRKSVDEQWKIIGWDDKIQDTSNEENKENEEKK